MAPIWPGSASGGNQLEGSWRSIIDIAAPTWRGGLYDLAGTYTYNQAGTSFAAAHVSALAIDLINWDQVRSSAQDWLNYNPGLLHATLLLMGDRQGQYGKVLTGGDSLWGVGRLRARLFSGAGMDEPWYFGYGTTCVAHGESVAIPVNFTPIGDINVIKAAIYWYEPLSASNTSGPNINLRLVNSNTGATIRQSTSFTNEYEFVAAREGNGGTDVVQNVPLELRLDGQNVAGSTSSGCLDEGGEVVANTTLVHYAYFFEDLDREEASPTAAQVPIE